MLLAGTGRLGRALGLHLLGQGLDLTWISRDSERLAAFAASMGRRVRALPGRARFASPSEAPEAEVLWETIEEDLAAKRTLLGELAPRAALVLSNSSSLLPRELHPRALGLHVFQPVGEVRLAEAVGRDPALDAFAARAGFELLHEDEASAFLANRLLLPLQVAAFAALRAGADPAAIDAASAPALAGLGVLSLMDAVGLDVLAAAAAAYRARMAPDDAEAAAPLVEGLAALVAAGKRGRKNRDGLLLGGPLPWAPTGASPPPLAGLVDAACREALARGLLPAEALDRLLREVWGARAPFDRAGPGRGPL